MFNIFNRKAIGKKAEEIAQYYLQAQGLSFIEKNFNCRRGEIDLIFKDKEIFVFVEVRYRKNHQYGYAFETVTKQKQQKIITAARHYLHQHKLTESVSSRFDVIGIEDENENGKQQKIDWIKNAF